MSELGKKINTSNEGAIEPQGAGCTILCQHLCNVGAITLCKCKNNKAANKGSSYYKKRNYQIAIHREPTSA